VADKILNIATALIVDKDHKKLFIKRIKDPYKNWFAFPGGKQEFGETLLEAMQREIFEETGINLNEIGHSKKIVSIVNETVEEDIEFEKFTDSGEKEISSVKHFDSHFLLTYWLIELHHSYTDLGFDLINQGNEGILQWFDQGNYPELIPSDQTILERYHDKLDTNLQLIECIIRQTKQDDRDELELVKWQLVG
jgi:8-oxo-dGTP pyrophosphatase MutT (NUDIX family)